MERTGCKVGYETITIGLAGLGLTPGLGRPSGEGKGYPPQYSGLENSMVCIVHEVTKSRTHLSDFHFVDIKEKTNKDLWYSTENYVCVCVYESL